MQIRITSKWFINNKRYNSDIPKSIDFGNEIAIEVVNTFKLVGATIDEKLNFHKQMATANLGLSMEVK
jgi:hypothetical protein